VVTEPLEHRGGRADGGHAVGVQRLAARMDVHQADAQAARIGAELLDVRPPRRRRDDRVADARPAHRVEDDDRVADRPRHAQLDTQPDLRS
jgi:hypothetical protein